MARTKIATKTDLMVLDYLEAHKPEYKTTKEISDSVLKRAFENNVDVSTNISSRLKALESNEYIESRHINKRHKEWKMAAVDNPQQVIGTMTGVREKEILERALLRTETLNMDIGVLSSKLEAMDEDCVDIESKINRLEELIRDRLKQL